MRKSFLLVGLIIFLFVIACEGEVSTMESNSKDCREEQIPYETTEEYQEEEIYYDQIPYEDEECNEIEIPYTATEEKQDILFIIEDKLIEPDDRLYQTVSLSKGMIITITFRADDKLNLWVVDDEEFEQILEGERSQNPYISQLEVSDAQEGFEVPVDDNYVIYLKNQDEWGNEDVSVYEFKAIATWEEEVTKIKTQEYCTTVTKYKEMEKTRTVTKTKPVIEYKTETVCD